MLTVEVLCDYHILDMSFDNGKRNRVGAVAANAFRAAGVLQTSSRQE
jgi:hypothetical protein